MDRADRVCVGRIGNEHARSNDVGRGPAELLDRVENDREAAPGLRRGVAARRGAVGLDRGGSRDEDAVADADRPREAERGFVGRGRSGAAAGNLKPCRARAWAGGAVTGVIPVTAILSAGNDRK